MSVELLEAALPASVTIQLFPDTQGDDSYYDVEVVDDEDDNTDPDFILEGMRFDAYCIDTDRTINDDGRRYTADVYSSYDLQALEDAGLITEADTETGKTGWIEKPQNLDLINWIINQGFEGEQSTGNGAYTSADVQRAIWSLIDDQQSTAGLDPGSWNNNRVAEILSLASGNDGFVPTYSYTTIFGEQITGQLAVIFVPRGAGGALKQFLIAGVDLLPSEPPPPPPQEPSPSIDVEKYVSVDGGDTWLDADDITGPHTLMLAGTNPLFKFVVQNTGDVDLTGVTLSDNVFNIDTVNGDNTIEIGLLTANDQREYIFTGATWTVGQHTNTATVAGSYTDDSGNTTIIGDNDDANYFGADPSIDVEKYVSVDGGDTWLDADDITGPHTLMLAGTNPLFKFVVQNTGNVNLTGVTLSDNVFNIDTVNGDNTIEIGVLTANDNAEGGSDQREYIFTGATWTVGQHTNTATVAGSYTDDIGNTTNPSDSDDANYFGADPSIAIDKVTKNLSGAAMGDGLFIQAGSSIEWIYTVINTGNVGLSNISVIDDQGVTVNYFSGDSDNDGILDTNETLTGVDTDGDGVLDSGETWLYKASGTAVQGSYSNTGKVTGSYTDDLGNIATPMDTDDSSYYGVISPGARTPGFWAQHLKLWDGILSNDFDNNGGGAGKDGFPISDLLLSPYSSFHDTNGDSNGDGKLENAIDPVTGQESLGLLVGDYNRNGMTDGGENTIFYTLDEAQTIVDASQKVQKDDKRYTLDRSLIASWLNWTAGNDAPVDDINDAIAWIQETTPDENNDGLGDGNLVLGASTYAVPASDSLWQDPTTLSSGDVIPSGENINNALDYYNNTGVIA